MLEVISGQEYTTSGTDEVEAIRRSQETARTGYDPINS